MPAEEMGNREMPQPAGVATRVVLLAVFGFLGFTAASMGGLYWYFNALVPGPMRAVERPFPQPELQINPQGDLVQFERDQRQALTGYEWVDRAKNLVRIPIEDAMSLVAARGEHAFDPLDGPAVTPTPGSRGGAQP